MKIQHSLLAVVAVACGFVLASVGAEPAQAAGKGKSVQTEADWINFDAEAQTITVKVRKAGKGKAAKMIKKGKEAVFNVKSEGTVLTRTTVKVNGRAGKLTDIPAGKRVLIYWKPKDGAPYARSIDVVFTEEELEARYPDKD